MASPPTSDPKKSLRAAWAVYRRLLGHALRYKGRLAATILLSVVSAVSFTAIIIAGATVVNILYEDDATVERQLVDFQDRVAPLAAWYDEHLAPAGFTFRDVVRIVVYDVRDNRSSALMAVSALLVVLVLFSAAARYFQEYYAGSIGAAITTDLSDEMYGNVVDLSHSFYERRSSGDIVARFTTDVMMVNNGLVNVFVKLFREPIKIVLLVAVALSVDVYLTLIVALVLSPLVLILLGVGRKVRKSVRRQLDRVAAVASIVSETVSGIPVIKAFRMEAYQQGRLRFELRKLRKQLVRLVQADAAITPAIEALVVIGVAVFIILSEQRVASQDLSVAALARLFGCLAATIDPLRKLAKVNNMIMVSAASAERVFAFIDQIPAVREKPGAAELAPLKDALRFEGVSFSYDGRADALRQIDLDIRAGELVALVGFSGAGKSTLVKLIPRFYDPAAGRITLDGIDLRDATLASLRDQIGIVTQDTILFHASVRDNIAYGNDAFPLEQVVDAARAAHADEFIESLPEGYETVLSEGGGNLSGGQRQRLAIARAIIKNPPLLLLDEATSNLDSESERLIQQAIARLVKGRATVVIAHRLSTIQRADRIVVMDRGAIVDTGTHEELLDRGGIYRRLHDLQLAPEREVPATQAR